MLAALFILYYIYKTYKNHNLTTRYLLRAQISGFFCVLFYGLSLSTNNVSFIRWLNNAIFLFFPFTILFISKYAFIYFDKEKIFPRKLEIFSYIFAFIDAILGFTAYLHPYYFKKEIYLYLNTDVYFSQIPNYLFWLHCIFCYSLILYVTIIMFVSYLKTPFVYKGKYTSIFMVIFFTVVLNLTYIFNISPFPVDISILSYGIVTCLFYHYTFNYQPKRLIYHTRNMLIDNITLPIILFDNKHLLTDFSINAGELFSLERTQRDFLTTKDFVTKHLHLDSLEVLESGEEIDIVLSVNSQERYFTLIFTSLSDKKGVHIGDLFVLHDITLQKTMYEKLKYLATYDSLTGLMNKNTFQQQLVNIDSSGNYPLVTIIGNINGLKIINDIFGTTQGDLLIYYVASVISKHIRQIDFSARLDGDETLIVMPNSTEKDAIAFIERVNNEFQQCNDFEFEVTMEFGIAAKEDSTIQLKDVIIMARNNMYRKKLLNVKSVHSALIQSLKNTLSQSDYETKEHAERVQEMCLKLGKRLHLKDSDLNDLALLAILHDIGKLAIPQHILSKPGKLTLEEMEIMKLHSTKGYEIANATPELASISKSILYHHERWDGTGYPKGLKGEEIPLLARIISLVDAHDVMTHDRPYHNAVSGEDAIESLKKSSGTQFDPYLCKTFIKLLMENDN